VRVRVDRWLPVTGLAMIVLFVGEGALSGTEPSAGSSGAKVIAFYAVHRGRLEVGDYLLSLAVVVGMFFFGHVREHIRVNERSPRLAAIMFGGAVLFAASGSLGAGASLALTDVPSRLDPAAAQVLNVLQTDFVGYTDNAGAAVLLIAAGLAILRGRDLPVWTGWLALVLAVVTFIPMPDIGAPPAALWSLVISVVFLWRTSRGRSIVSPEHAQPAPSPAR